MVSVIVPACSSQVGMAIKTGGEIGQLTPSASSEMTLGVDFNDTLQPAKFDIWWANCVGKAWFSESLFSELPFIVHNLCCERSIFKKKLFFSSCLVVLQYGVLRSVIYFGPKLSIFWKKRGLLVGVFSKWGLFSELTLIVHNLCCECLISILKVAFSSCLVVLRYTCTGLQM